MILLPISHEDLRTRRWPAVTAGIVVVTIAASSSFLLRERAAEQTLRETRREAMLYWRDHLYLRYRPDQPADAAEEELSPELTRFLPKGHEDEQRHLDGLVASLKKQEEDLPVFRWAWIPAKMSAIALVSHQLLHGGVLHLGFNLWFLLLTGINLEDRWGRRVFPFFYLACGAVAAFAHAYFTAQPSRPMIGASGAIAGAMGAFLVLFARTKIRFFYWPNLRGQSTFLAPAWLMLPLWFAGEIFDGIMTPSDGVARFAHVGGFAFGALFAWGMKQSGLDRKLDTQIERALVSERDPRLTEADAMIQAGRFGEAFAQLDALVAERPAELDARLLLLRASEVSGDSLRRADAFAGLIGAYGRAGRLDPMLSLYSEAVAAKADGSVSAADRVRIAKTLEERGDAVGADDAYRRAHGGVATDVIAVRAMYAHAALAARSGDKDEAATLYSTLARSDGAAQSLRGDVLRELETLTREGARPQPRGAPMSMNDFLDLPEPTFDVVVSATPDFTPAGEPFVPALAAAFGVPEEVAARLAAGAPMKVKRGIPRGDAEAMERLLTSLGAAVELLGNDVSVPASMPATRVSIPVASRATSAPPVVIAVGPAPVVVNAPSNAPAPIGIVTRPSMAPPLRASGAPLPQAAAPAKLELPFTIPTSVIRWAGVAAVIGLLLLSVRWLKMQTQEHTLGNASKGESRCINKDCLAMLGLDRKGELGAQLTLVVAWRDGCLPDGYGAYLDGLHEKHGKKGLQIVGAGLGVPSSNDPRAMSMRPQAPPAEFPPAGCEPAFRVVPTRSGFVEDFFSPPATYLYDDGGYMMAVWKGGMSPAQREQLASYLDKKL
jgi:membrane associated rhomboid family serine protease